MSLLPTIAVLLAAAVVAVPLFQRFRLSAVLAYLASGMLLGIPVVLGPMLFLGRRVRSISTRNQDRIADVGTVTSEVLGSMKIVQAFNQQGREATRFSDAVERVFATAKRRIALRALLTAMMIFLMIGSIVLVIWQGAVDVAAGRMSGGSIAAFVLCGGLLAGAFGNLSEVYGDLLRAAGASERLNELLEAEPDIQAPATPKSLPEPARGGSLPPGTRRVFDAKGRTRWRRCCHRSRRRCLSRSP